MRSSPLPSFLLRFILAYGVLIAPWPGWKALHGDLYRAVGNVVFRHDEGTLAVAFVSNTEKNWPRGFDTLIILADRHSLPGGPQIRLALDSWQLGWIPCAFFFALALAVKLSLRRRIFTLVGGGLLLQVYFLLGLSIFIENESTRLFPEALSPGWQGIAKGLETVLIDNPAGANLVVPLLIVALLVVPGSGPWSEARAGEVPA